jgi:hypothetical protein
MPSITGSKPPVRKIFRSKAIIGKLYFSLTDNGIILQRILRKSNPFGLMAGKKTEGDTVTRRLKEQGFETGSCTAAYGAERISHVKIKKEVDRVTSLLLSDYGFPSLTHPCVS